MKDSDVKVLILEGTPRERGRIYGRTMKSRIKRYVNLLKLLVNYYYKENPDKVINQFVDKTYFIDAVKKYTPHLLEEVDGLAEGTGINFNMMFAAQCQDEFLWYKYLINQNSSRNCSTIGCYKESNTPALLAQTLDWAFALKDLMFY